MSENLVSKTRGGQVLRGGGQVVGIVLMMVPFAAHMHPLSSFDKIEGIVLSNIRNNPVWEQ